MLTVGKLNMPCSFFCSKKYLTQKNVVEKVSANVSQGKVRIYLFLFTVMSFVILQA